MISVVVPTHRRPRALKRCLDALDRQTAALAVVVVARADDELTPPVVAAHGTEGVELESVRGRGLAHAMNAGLAAATAGDVVAFTDDDARPRPDWAARIERWFAQAPRLGAVGGRDVVHRADGSIVAPDLDLVGRVRPSGRLVGGHHRGRGPARPVDFLKGVNMAFRRAAIDGLRFDEGLAGPGAQVHVEMGFCLEVGRRGWGLVYDPELLVDHHPEARVVGPPRRPTSDGAEEEGFNEVRALRGRLGRTGRASTLAYGLVMGTSGAPGLARGARSIVRRDRLGVDLVRAAWRGRMGALRSRSGPGATTAGPGPAVR